MNVPNFFLSIAILILFSLTFISSAEANTSTVESFVQKAAVANKFEIDSSQLALQKSNNSEIRRFAERMVNDHTKVGERFTTTLQSINQKAPETLDEKHKKLIERLEQSSGDDFNRLYVQLQTDAHKEAVDLFTDYSKNGKDPTLRDFAEKTLPDLKSHLEDIRKIKVK
ncbi:MAG: DUF4142 domain-containing protein [Alphaproteobacteria bacterium]|nr:DUF4142 domain-containing protein [Alphaproteobacteria bacterium]